MEQHQVIDETFAGLSRPSQTFEMGRPDIVEDRPGAVLVAEVRAFEAEGGFVRIADERDARRAADQALDDAPRAPRAPRVRAPAYDVEIKGSYDAPTLDASDD
jgi:hypothetical protein